jgi:hypothetical protein
MPPALKRQDSTTESYAGTINTLSKQGVTDLFDTAAVQKAISVNARNGEPTMWASRRAKLNGVLNEVREQIKKATDADDIKKLLKLKEFYDKAHDSAWKEQAKQEEDNRGCSDFVAWDKLKDLYLKPDLTGQEKAILALFTLFPPRRTQDYALMKVAFGRTPTTAVQKTNWIVLSSDGERAKFVFRQYKTRGLYASQEFPVPENLFKVLKESGVLNTSGGSLFKTPTGLDYDSSSFTNTIAKLTKKLGVRATVNTFRHSFVTDFLLKNPPYSERVRVANMMAHSVGEQSKYDCRETWGVALCPCDETPSAARFRRRNAGDTLNV